MKTDYILAIPTTPLPADTATASSNWSSNATYSAIKAIDGILGNNDANTWFSAYADAAPWLKLHFVNPKAATGYHLTMAYCSSAVYNPSTWTVSGSNDDTNWTVIDVVSEDQVPVYQPYNAACSDFGPTYQIDNPGNYLYYKLDFGPTASPSTNAVGIGEIELLN